MRVATVKDAKYNRDELIVAARLNPVVVARYDRAVIVVMAVEEFERLWRMSCGIIATASFACRIIGL